MYADSGEPHQGVILKRLKKPAFAGFFNAQNLKNNHVIKNFSTIIEEKNRDLVILEEKMNYLVNNLLDKKSHLLELKRHRLLGVNPKEVLKRGYTITLKNGKVVKDKNTINNGDEIESYFYNGAVKSIVKE